MEVYYIGGSPCSGKSSIAELIVAKHGFTYYKLDDFIFPYMQQAADGGSPLSAAQLSMDFEQMWMRDPKFQAQEEFAVYAEIFPYALKDIAALHSQRPIIAEGAGFYPELMKQQGIRANRYICIVPTERFQQENYAKREWIGEYLKGCSDPSQAFNNWMRRDALFAAEVRNQAKMFGYASILVDGKNTIAENFDIVMNTFELA
ncbi:hypothetical protein LJC07_06120 [Christensenellaceae bacterium OttesenSCG-928-L17]|nr:hypothetical protein [Christensenellaceae bacterium OttesenSCG-928-L17]